ncbi:multicopper oxidase domain-containing protein [Thiomicrorhabdus sp. Kp2]|uniref:multicopper oxidase domain-containing protein n=1 Tax=Thiomicrorhabdus sp. Kp2 TaxID=1123518 RepID=UPI000428C577|nr:multicopper oxidase domain-containing protein [Thiomicrorhabdus sp. Kp2]
MTIFKTNISNTKLPSFFSVITVLTVFIFLLTPVTVRAMIIGETGSNFNLTASEGYISIADGGSIYSWGYSNNGIMQLPGPTLIVDQGTTVTVTLNNSLPAAAGNTSIVFPGHQVTTSSGVAGKLTQEAPAGGSVTYSFVANTPGTYQYHSGTRPDLQIEMGLYGALIVRPSAPAAGCTVASAYDHSETCYDREYLYLLSEIDMEVHQAAQQQASGPGPIDVGTGPFHPEYWLLNGRAAPDTMAAAGTDLLPNQPYNAMTRMHPGEKLLLRLVAAGRDMHPFHTHGNHSRVLARDGRLLLSATDASQLAGPLLYTIPAIPGGTVDAIFEWTGKDLGWDMYGHSPSDPMEPNEWAPDHGKPIPVELPSLSSMAFGGFYSGSPFLGAMGSLPPGEGGLNPGAGYAYMWHSHTEREMVNNDVFPGGMMTMLIIEAPSVTITE